MHDRRLRPNDMNIGVGGDEFEMQHGNFKVLVDRVAFGLHAAGRLK